MSRLAAAAMPLLRRLDAETAHRLSLAALRLGLGRRRAARGDPTDDPAHDPRLAVTAFGRRLINPIGLAAGFDKNGVALNALGDLGFGFIEAGTVTLRPQAGNPKPRLFRLQEERAVINRMGFNNAGIEALLPRLSRADRSRIAIGANIGINKENAAPERDYPYLAAKVSPHVDYIAINISSPNTPGLRDLQQSARLAAILDRLRENPQVARPVFVKIAPDLDEAGLAAIVETCIRCDVAGLIVANTTLARPAGLQGAHRAQAGGLSGAPLFEPSTRLLAAAHRLSRGRLELIGVGGIFSAADVLAKILAGARLVQLYTGFAYAGPALIPRLASELSALLAREGFADVESAIGKGA